MNKLIQKSYLQNEFLINVLDEPFSIHEIIFKIKSNFREINAADLKSNLMQIIKYLLESKFYTIGDLKSEYELEEWNLSLNEILKKINMILEKEDNDLLWDIWFDLSKMGKQIAKAYLLKKINLREKILTNNVSFMDFRTFLNMIKEEFPEDDFNELKDKAIDLFYYLFNRDFIKIENSEGLFNFNSNYNLDSEFQKLGRMPSKDEIGRIINTDATKALVKKWKKCGGRLVDDWYELIDRN